MDKAIRINVQASVSSKWIPWRRICAHVLTEVPYTGSRGRFTRDNASALTTGVIYPGLAQFVSIKGLNT